MGQVVEVAVSTSFWAVGREGSDEDIGAVVGGGRFVGPAVTAKLSAIKAGESTRIDP